VAQADNIRDFPETFKVAVLFAPKCKSRPGFDISPKLLNRKNLTALIWPIRIAELDPLNVRNCRSSGSPRMDKPLFYDLDETRCEPIYPKWTL